MWFKDFQIIKKIHDKYNLSGPLLDAGGLENPTVADYDISVKKAYRPTLELGGHRREIVVPHENQKDRYIPINRPWKFIDKDYLILNPENGAPSIEELPKHYEEQFQTVILTSVFEHVVDPFICSDALYKIIKPGGYIINCAPFMFPQHDEVDNWRYSPQALRYIHEKSGFTFIEGDYHIQYKTTDGIGNYHDFNEPQPIIGCYVFCQK